MGYIILVNLQGRVVAIQNDIDKIHVFETHNEAQKTADDHWLCKSMDYQIVELEF